MLRYLLAALLLIALPASAESIDCRVIGIADGDTFSCLTVNRDQVRVAPANGITEEQANTEGHHQTDDGCFRSTGSCTPLQKQNEEQSAQCRRGDPDRQIFGCD